MVCRKCGNENRKETKFCTSCGARLPRNRRRGNTPARGRSHGKVVVFAGAVLMFALVWGFKPGVRDANIASAAPSKLYSRAVIDVASKFNCACGSCDEPELAACTCPTAINEKDMIDRELKSGKTQNHILALLNERYGGIKPQFTSLLALSVESRPVDVSSRSLAGIESIVGDAEPPPGTATLATVMDGKGIEQHFICACGECQDHVLSECTCDHPRGAQEMKAFIAYKISQKRFTIEDIVKSVTYEYGHFIER